MKNLFLLILAGILLVACGENAEESAEKLLGEARAAMEQRRFDDGRTLIDSLRRTYPKAVEGRRNAIKLENELELTDAKLSLAKVDSVLKMEAETLESLKKEFVLEKDSKYQAVGYYLSPDQVTDKMHRTSLRGMVNEEGLMVLVSIVHGERLNHKTVTVEDKEGQICSTPQCFSFLTHNVVGYEEEASYKWEDDGGVIDFISDSQGDLTVTYNGETKSLSRPLHSKDKQAVSHCLTLAKQFASVKKLNEKRKELDLKVRFFEKKISLQ